VSRKCYVDITQAESGPRNALLALAECVACDSFSSESLSEELRLAFDSAGWNLYFPNKTGKSAGQSKVAVDYAQPSFARRLEADNLSREFAVRAVRGRKKSDYQPLVLDATAGFGRDSFLLAASGCHVVQAERIPVLAYLLEQALKTAVQNPCKRQALAAQRCRVVCGESTTLMADWHGPAPDVVYLDPMYLDPNKPADQGLKASAGVKKNMRALQLLTEIYEANYPAAAKAASNQALFAAATSLAVSKVVVKRAPSAPVLAGMQPSSCLTGKSARFDVYAL